MSVTSPEPARERRSLGGLIVPLLLIAVGVVVLLGNLGYLAPISIRAVLSLWPLVLVLVGIEILLARRQPFLSLTLQLLAIAAGIALVASQPAGLFGAASSGATTTGESVARDGASSLELRVSGGGGRYEVRGGAAGLVDARSTGGELEVRTERTGDAAEVRVSPAHDRFELFSLGVPREVIVQVASDVRTSVHVEGGAGEFFIDLREVDASDASIEGGAGEFRVVLPRPKGSVPVAIQAGAASVTIEVPDGVEARVTTRGGALSLSSDNARLEVRNGGAETSGYATATDRVTVSFEGGAASVRIR